MIRFTDYANICNNYCICYFGYSDEYLVQLRLLQPIIERHMQGLNIFLGCRDEKIGILKGCDKTLRISDLKVRKDEFAHIRELQYNGSTHPVEDLMKEVGEIDYKTNTPPLHDRTVKCVIITKSNHPTSSLLEKQTKTLTLIAKEAGYSVEYDSDISNSGLVMGVESYGLFEAASRGIETRLVPTGVGTRLYKRMFLNTSVLNV